ncbi:MAG: hypothetical protein ABIR62_12695 [Dokdonella sp.]|uniref:hypothetical protein n=1 Tax=Dokdonella sp. TaxID=2291710 RepID=UPI003266EEA8
MIHRALTILTAGFALLLCAVAVAGTPHLDGLAVSDSESGRISDSFASDTPRLFLHASLIDVPSGSHLSSVWIATDTNGVAPPNFKLRTVELTTDTNDVATFAVNKPADGWPAGSYIVDLFINGTASYKVRFTVQDR